MIVNSMVDQLGAFASKVTREASSRRSAPRVFSPARLESAQAKALGEFAAENGPTMAPRS
ncbi:hypothetical protein C8R42DRAFT_663447 [Lentinula raphanica]|nr:hypothetical protein C8R42DRAFT_663447 [Lentinula raphanica]